jgi:hypothetical protein
MSRNTPTYSPVVDMTDRKAAQSDACAWRDRD